MQLIYYIASHTFDIAKNSYYHRINGLATVAPTDSPDYEVLTLYCTYITYKGIGAECTGHTCTFQLLQAGFRDTLASSLADIVLLQLAAEKNIFSLTLMGSRMRTNMDFRSRRAQITFW